MIKLLEPLFSGELRPYGEALTLAEDLDAAGDTIAEWMVDPARLSCALALQAQLFGSKDLRPVVSAWALRYFSTLLPPVVAAACLLDHAFPVRWDQMRLRLDEHGSPIGFVLPSLGERRSAVDSADRHASLLSAHLHPLIDHLCARTRVSPKVLWGNAARCLDFFFAYAIESAHEPARRKLLLTDRNSLLLEPRWPDGRRNPLFFRQREARSQDGRQTSLTLHRQCCLSYLLPSRAHCTACPLAPENLQAQVRNFSISAGAFS